MTHKYSGVSPPAQKLCESPNRKVGAQDLNISMKGIRPPAQGCTRLSRERRLESSLTPRGFTAVPGCGPRPSGIRLLRTVVVVLIAEAFFNTEQRRNPVGVARIIAASPRLLSTATLGFGPQLSRS